ncbi:MAG: twin-arginine translocation signal domain-containing protein, partial [Rhizomicrobium sp.]
MNRRNFLTAVSALAAAGAGSTGAIASEEFSPEAAQLYD